MLEMFQQVEDPSADMNAVWDAEYNQRVSQWALEKVSDQVQPRTLQAFVETAVENRDPATVATELGMSYLAKARVISRIREQIEVIGDA